MLKARLTNVEEWKSILSAISDIAEDAIFISSKDGVTFRGLDSNQMALLDVNFPKKSFKKLEATVSHFGVKINDFSRILSFAKEGDVIEFKKIDRKFMKIIIKSDMKMEYKLHLIQRQKSYVPIPDGTYESRLSLELDRLDQILTNIHQMSKFVKIQCFSKKVVFSGEGNIGEAKINLNEKNSELKLLTTKKISSATYDLAYISKILRNIGKASKMVNLEYSNNNPIHIAFDMESKTQVNYYLAPNNKE